MKEIQIPKLENSKQFYIYVLELVDGKYYVGKTHHLNDRIRGHLFNSGATWTKIYPPIKFEKIYVLNDVLDEDKIVKRYMQTKGINNVRGGAYCQENLPKCQQQALVKEMIHSTGRCFYCYGEHFITVSYYFYYFYYFNFLFFIY